MEEKQDAEIISGTVKSGDLRLEDSEIKLKVKGDSVEVTTKYSIFEEGFGENYLSGEKLKLEISLEEFSVIVENDSVLKVELVYGEISLVETEKDIFVEDFEIIKIGNETIVEILNETLILNNETNFSVETVQFGAILGKPVRWIKKINVTANETSSISVELPSMAENITIKKIDNVENLEVEENEESEIEEVEENEESEIVEVEENEESEIGKSLITGKVSADIELKKTSGFVKWFRKFFKITGRVIQEEVQDIVVDFQPKIDEIEIEYETPAPYAEETDLENGKKVKIVGPPEIHYENVLAFTEISESLEVKSPEKLRIYWEENQTFLSPLKVLDLNSNGVYDYVEWIVPHLSNQTFEIIVIVKAEHLDLNRTFISDIYNEVKELDGIWSELINDGEYVRVVFEKKLTSENDITIYPRIINGNLKIEIYEENGTDLISEFSEINENQYNKVYLDNLIGEQDTFDLKILNGSVEFDHIIDPLGAPNIDFVSPTPTAGSSQTDTTITVNLTTTDDSTFYSFTDFDRDLLLWMRFDDSNSSGDPVDLSSYSKNGTLTSATLNSSGYSAPFGDVVVIDQINRNPIENVHIPNFNLTELAWPNGSLSFWFNYSTTHPASYSRLLNNERANNRGLSIRTSTAANDRWDISLRNSAGSAFGFIVSFLPYTDNAGTWNHVTLTWNQHGALKAYVDGSFVKQDTSINDIPDSGNILSIGSHGYTQVDSNLDFQMDDLLVFSRELTSTEVLALYSSESPGSSYEREFTGLSLGTHNFTGHSVDTLGNKNSTSERQVTIDLVPDDPSSITINSTDGSNRTLQDLHSTVVITDPSSNVMNLTVQWFKNNALTLTQNLNNNYASGSQVNVTLDSGNTTKGENWIVGYISFNGVSNSSQVNSSAITIENTPPVVTLTEPENGDLSTDRTPTFSWETIDDDNDDVSIAELNLSLHASSVCTDGQEGIIEVLEGVHTLTTDLSCLIDNGDYYNWTIRVTDGVEFGDFASERNLSIQSLIAISMPVSSVEFGGIDFRNFNDTTDDSPGPLVIQNDGNAYVNVTIHATDLWNTVTNPNSYFQYKVDNVTATGENASFNADSSILTFSNIPFSKTPQVCLAELNYTDATDSAEIDLNVTVPNNEGSGVRSSVITFTATLGE